MSVDSGTENKKATEAPKKETDPAVARQRTSKAYLALLPLTVKRRLIKAASMSDLVFRRLGAGDWAGMVRALRGLHLDLINRQQPSQYDELAELIESKAPASLMRPMPEKAKPSKA